MKSNIYATTLQRLSDKHWQQWTGERGLNPDWVTANVFSVDAKEASDWLGYPAKSGGVIIQGANSEYQFRPDQPWSDKQGKKAPKYRTAAKVEGGGYDALLPKHPDVPGFWDDIDRLKASCYRIEDRPCLLITEGGAKAIAPTSHGYPTIALLGVTMGLTPASADPQGKRYLVPTLEKYARAGFGAILAFDADINHNPSVRTALYTLGKQYQKFEGVPVYVLPKWDENQGKGIDDYIQMQGIEAFRERLLARVIEFDSWATDYERDRAEEKAKKQDTTKLCWEILTTKYELKWNELSMSVEMDGQEVDGDKLWFDLRLLHDCKIGKDEFYAALLKASQQHSYHPVRDYLNRCADNVAPIDITNLSQRYFGTIDPIHNEMMYRHLIGSVARVFNPGCKKDEAVVLQGPQGIGKSTYWDHLYGGDFFTDSVNGTERDDLLVMHQFWACELAEIEQITGRKQAGELKAFLSRSIDTFREPYGRQSKKRPRSSVIVGSVNPQSFLVDDTGNRRFWVIPVKADVIDCDRVESERDAIWAAAVQAYRNGETWYLPKEFSQRVNDLNENYRNEDSWLVPISNYLEYRHETTVHEVLTKALEFEVSKINKRDEMRVASILSELGWKRGGRKNIGGKRVKLWVKDFDSSDLPDPPLPEVGHEVGQPETLTQQGLVIPDLPDLPFSQTFPQQLPTSTTDVGCSEPEKVATGVGQVGHASETTTEQGLQADPPSDPPSDPPNTPDFRKGDRVRVNCPNISEFHDKLGVIDKEIEGHAGMFSVCLEGVEDSHCFKSDDLTIITAKPKSEPTEIDFSTFPHRTSDNIRAKEKQARHIKEALLNASDRTELTELKGSFGEAAVSWVWGHLLTNGDRQLLKTKAGQIQGSLDL